MRGLKRFTIAIIGTLLLATGCGNSRSTSNKEHSEQTPTTIAYQYDYRVVAEYPHSELSYTQGLQYVDGKMWESTGQWGESLLVRYDLHSGEREILASLPEREFGEGMTLLNGSIYQLTWTSKKAYRYDMEGNILGTYNYRGEGWGLTTDGSSLYLSDGTSTIRRINPETFATEESICVTIDGEPLDYINELEWIDGHIWANIYLSTAIVKIDPATGVVVGYIVLPELRHRLQDNPNAEVLNGITFNPESGNLLVTGKYWNRIFEIQIMR